MKARPACLPAALLAAAALSVAGCYARSFPLPPVELADVESTPSPSPLPLDVGVRGGEEGANVFRVRQAEVVQRFAEQLAESGLFERVIHPPGPLAVESPLLVFELTIRSRHDLHAVRNLARDVAAGATLLLLQPLLPTTWDLELELGLRALVGEERVVWEEKRTSRHRFESDWLHPPDAAVAEWYDRATQQVLDQGVSLVRAHREQLAAATEVGSP